MAKAAPEPEFVVDFPTLGFLGADWIEAHCIIPDGFKKGRPYVMADWQLWCTANHYRVRPDAAWDPEAPIVSTNFVYRRSQVVAPQKTGKGPWAASIISLEALGPTVFIGWAQGGEQYRCDDWGCSCGWVYTYEPGEPMGMPRPTPLIQLTATSKDQTANVYRPLKAMFRGGWLTGEAKTGEEFIKLPGDGRIDTVTSSARARLGNPVTFVLQDESGIYTKTNGMVDVATTQRRGLAGMDARSIETTNCWDPSEQSTAQKTYEGTVTDVFKFYRPPPAHLSYKNKAERRQIHRYVYEGSWWVNLDAIEGEAAELMLEDPAQAERFFGNKLVYGSGSWCEGDKWDARAKPREVPAKTPIVLGFDGSDSDDWTAIRAQTRDGYQFTPTFGADKQPTIWDPAGHGGQVPRKSVEAAVEELFERFQVVRMYCDPPDWKSEIDDWAEKFGDKRVIRWETYRLTQMHSACVRLHADVTKTDTSFEHDGCPITKVHVRNARKLPRPGQRYVLGKPNQKQKIDACVTSVLCNEAAGDVTAAGLWPALTRKKMVVRG